MFKRNVCLAAIMLLIIFRINAAAAVPVAVMPFEGDSSAGKELEVRIKDILSRSGGITVVADKMMNDILKTHEKAQVVGSSVHDMSKLKVAEFLITGSISDGKLNLKAVDVNTGTEVYSQTVEVSGENSKRLIAKAVKDMSDKILFSSASKNTDIPADAKPYMDLISQLAGSLGGGGDESSYRYIAVYSKGAYIHPDSENKKAAESAKLLLKIMRQDLLRAKLYYISMRGESFWVYIEVVAEKAGKKTKYKFGILELDDGSLGIGIYEEAK